ncbi:MAG: hypothetical protein GY809_04325, partial [Planctomycetes bacterium]|nr:hypothetical protein [Planctomycetota bacterium]
MASRMTWLLSFALALGLLSTGYGEVVVVGDFETGLDGFWGNNDFVITQSSTAATRGTKSLQAEGPGGWQMGIYLNTKPYQTVLGMSGATITADITAFPADMTTNWMNVDMVLNAQNNDDNGANNNVGWQPLGQEAITLDGEPHTYTWALSESLISAIAATDDTIAWFELIIVSNTDGASVAQYYLDNIQFSYPDPVVGKVIGDFEAGLDGWWGGGEFTLTSGPTGATLNAQALQVDGPGNWQMGAYLNLKSHREAMGAPGTTISADITAFDADMATSWMNIEMIINGQNNDDNGANNNVGWQQLGGQDLIRDGQPHTYMWEIPEDLTTLLAGVDDSIAWFELVVVSNLEGETVKYYMDNVQLISPVVETEKSTDLVIGNWEQDLEGWVVGGGAEDLFRYNDANGVTLGEYSLDLFVREGGGWNQDILTLDVLAAGLEEAFTHNTTISVDVTRMVADWPEDNIPRWNEVAMIVNTGGDDWNAWVQMPVLAGWNRNDGDQTLTASWNYGERRAEMNNLKDMTYLELFFVTNVDNEYTGTNLLYLDNMKLSGAGGALDPQPPIAATDVAIAKTLTWRSGIFAASHHLYFGTEMSKVFGATEDNHADVTFATLDANSFDPDELLAFNTKYYWRVDEVNEVNPDSPWRGGIWNFTTADFVAIDDFEGYTDVEPDRPFDTWVDGYGQDDNGALAGYVNAPFSETMTVHSGLQSLPMGYNNVGADVTRSEIQRVWAEPQNWTFDGFFPTAMELYTRGGALTTAGLLYVMIEDNDGVSSGQITNPDSGIFSSEDWVQWSIPLDAIVDAGVNLATVKKMTIGVSDVAGQDEAWGTLFLDDIRIYPPATLALE